MADAFNVLPYFKTPDFVTPIHAAMEMANARDNARTQRMFAENTMARESAAEFRAQREEAEKKAEREHRDKIEAAGALERAQQMLRTPGGAGPAQALIEAYGGHLNPLLAATAAAHAPTGDAVDQALSEAGPSPAPELGPAGYPAPAAPEATAAPPAAPAVDPGVAAIMEGRTVQHAPEGDFVLPQGTPANLASAAEHQGYVPRGSTALPPSVAPGGPASASPDLEALMSRAAPAPAPAPAKPPIPTLYEAVMGPNRYQLSAEQPTTGLGDKYEALAKAYETHGATPVQAFQLALKDKEKDDAAAATTKRVMDEIAARNTEAEKLRGTYNMTAADRMRENEKNRANARSVAAIRASSGGATPAQEGGLAELLRMKEGGATDSEITTRAAELKIPEKAWRAAVKNVQTEAVSGNRVTEKREGLVATDENGKNLGVWKSPQVAADMNKKIQAWAQLKNRYQAAIDDVKQNGARINPLDLEAVQRRDSLFAAAAAAARVYNGLGATDASQRLEAEILGARGTIGHGVIKGANTNVLQHVFDEAAAQHQARLHTGLRPGGGTPLPKSVTHEGSGGGAAGEPDLDGLLKFSESIHQ